MAAWSFVPVVPRAASVCLLDKAPRSIESHEFSRHFRLTQAAAYTRVFKQGQRYSDKLLTIVVREADNADGPGRLGLAISKRVAPRAVDRNRLKRLVRESFRMHRDQLKGFEIVVMAKPSARHADNQAIFSSLSRQWNRALTGAERQRSSTS